MTIIQKRAANRIEFKFGDDTFRYSCKDPSGVNTFELSYEDMPEEHTEFEERRAWFRNVGWLWIIIGAAQVIINLTQQGRIGLPFWFLLGAGCLGYYHYSSTKFIAFDTARGRLFIIVDGQKEKILCELRRRAERIKADRNANTKWT